MIIQEFDKHVTEGTEWYLPQTTDERRKTEVLSILLLRKATAWPKSSISCHVYQVSSVGPMILISRLS